ncbi:hypothetical protein AB6A40_001302 [Gnathostoma spinigerum]|uniref:3-dehydrosphinganine reductase n=1 Tax=Gnathostoma spinigerum TaxID=75299 RepID=A0ABD6ECP4_9BILA
MIFTISVLLILSSAIFTLLIVWRSLPAPAKFVFNGKHALVTGGSKGIGKAIARNLVQRGCSVTIAARSSGNLRSACDELRSFAVSTGSAADVDWIILDVSLSYENTESVIKEIERKHGCIDLLVNNAGVSLPGIFEKIPVEEFERVMKINYLGTVYACRAVVESMKKRRSGCIAFVCSQAAQCSIFGYTAYGPSKHAQKALAESLFAELLPYDVGVSVVFPPNTETEGFEEEYRAMPEELREISESGGLVKPEDVAISLLDGIAAGRFNNSVGSTGWFLNTLTSGCVPETSLLQALAQITLIGLFRAAGIVFLSLFNSTIAKNVTKGKR